VTINVVKAIMNPAIPVRKGWNKNVFNLYIIKVLLFTGLTLVKIIVLTNTSYMYYL